MSNKRKATPEDIDLEILRQLREPDKGDEDHYFGLSIAMSLKEMEPQLKAYAKIKIQQVLYEVRFASIPNISPTQCPASQPYSQYHSTLPPTHPSNSNFNNPGQSSPISFPIQNYTDPCSPPGPKY